MPVRMMNMCEAKHSETKCATYENVVKKEILSTMPPPGLDPTVLQ
jgi:hypothetical protein